MIKKRKRRGHILITKKVYNGQIFKMGDILKASSWRAPAKNRARGNVLEADYSIQWTGPLYLR